MCKETNKLIIYVILCQNITGFLPKTLPPFFQNGGRTENVAEFEFERFQKNIFWRFYKYNIYIVKTDASNFKYLLQN